MDPKLELVQGMGKWLHTTLKGVLDDLNTDLAAKVKTTKSGTTPPVFTVEEGEVISLPNPVLTAKYAWKSPRQDGDRLCDVTVAFRIMCLVPVAGPNTTMAFEMARRVASDHVSTVFYDETRVLLPVIDAGIIPAWRAMGAQIGREDDIFPALMPDEKTTAHGWQTVYQATFSLRSL